MATKQTTAPTQLKVGDRVMLPGSGRTGTVVEDQGPLAHDGTQMVGVELDSTGHLLSVAARFLERIEAN